jgi:murein DD-endopeptidase MepM/ murein hydrolase activator NlpD
LIRAAAVAGVAILLLPSPTRDGLPPPRDLPLTLTLLEGTVSPRTTLATLLPLSPSLVAEIVEAARPVYNLARLSVGHPFSLTLGPGGMLAAFTYGIDDLRRLHVERSGESLAARIEERHYTVTPRLVAGQVHSSLFAAVEAAGEDDDVAIGIAEVYAWDVDFHTELQRGDAFRVVLEGLDLDGRPVRTGRILAAELALSGKRLRAVYFDAEGCRGYYAPDGTPLQKAFLRSPLRYTRISSGFTRARVDPILGTLTPHLGIDYAAPLGTPVVASGDGRVVWAGWFGGFGETVRIRHPNGYETLYGHLSQILVGAGTHVVQGEVIGRVGSSGHSTGPHLDYRVLRDGTPLNPLTMELPPSEPIPERARPAFDSVRDQSLRLLDLGS